MVHKAEIENFKSAQDLSIELKRFNILIGENGSGKSNILEAIVFASCALTGKLNPITLTGEKNGFEDTIRKSVLELQGVRKADPKFYRSGFESQNINKQITIHLYAEGNYKIDFEINHSNEPFGNWDSFIPIPIKGKTRMTVEDFNKNIDVIQKAEQITREKIQSLNLTSFMIYSPENYFVRTFTTDVGYQEPIGIRGEGLLRLFKLIATEKKDQFEEIITYLRLFDWYEGIELSTDKIFNETEFILKDKYLIDGLQSFNLNNANEGFYFLLFYLTLFISDYTPKFFAIDNIDTALNPKLCSKVISLLFDLAVKHDKQVIITTHNPSILDGLDLNNPEQRLYTISRNKLGYTKATRIEKKHPVEGVEPLKLSEQFLRGYIGGLPKNF